MVGLVVQIELRMEVSKPFLLSLSGRELGTSVSWDTDNGV